MLVMFGKIGEYVAIKITELDIILKSISTGHHLRLVPVMVKEIILSSYLEAQSLIQQDPSISTRCGIDALDLTNTGSDNSVIVGYNPVSTGTSSALFEFDISEIPFTLAATPTEMTLQLDLVTIGQSKPMTIAVYPCATFDESLVDYATAPVCSQTEITRTTITGSSGSTIDGISVLLDKPTQHKII